MTTWPKLIAALAIAVALFWLYMEIRQGGADSVKTAIERQNNDAASSADDNRTAYDRCLDRGGLWNFGAGRCDGPSQSGGD